MAWRGAWLGIAGLAGLGSVALAGTMAGRQGDQPDHNGTMAGGPATADGPSWIFQGNWLDAGADPDGSLWYIEQSVSDFTAWPLRVIARAHHPRGGRLDWTQRDLEIDCDRHLVRVLRTIRQGHAGAPGEPDERGDGRFRDAERGSGLDLVRIFVCDGPDSLPGRSPPSYMAANKM